MIERLLRAFWAGAFPGTDPTVRVHEGRPGPTDPRASALLVWSASPRPALLTVFDVSHGPATHGLDRAWHLAEALPDAWRAAIRIVPADGPTVRAWSERVRLGHTGQASHPAGRIRCTVTDEWVAGLPVLDPEPGTDIMLGVSRPSVTAAPALRALDRGTLPGWLRTVDGSCLAVQLTPGPTGVRWSDPSWWLGPTPEAVWFDATADPRAERRVQVAPRADTEAGQMEWVHHNDAYALRWLPRDTTDAQAPITLNEPPSQSADRPDHVPRARAAETPEIDERTTVPQPGHRASERVTRTPPHSAVDPDLQTVQLDRRAIPEPVARADEDDEPTQPLERPDGVADIEDH